MPSGLYTDPNISTMTSIIAGNHFWSVFSVLFEAFMANKYTEILLGDQACRTKTVDCMIKF
jgi:hypothetical protein